MAGRASELSVGCTVEGLGDDQWRTGHRSCDFIQGAFVEATESLNDAAIAPDQEERWDGQRVIKPGHCEIDIKRDWELYWSSLDQFAGGSRCVLRYAEDI